MEGLKNQILCIDDDRDTCQLVKFALEQEGFQVTTCGAASEGITYVRKSGFDLIILDSRFENMSGIEVCREIRSFNQQTPILFFSGEARNEEIKKSLKAGANAYLVKPLGFENLTQTVIDLIEKKQSRVQL